MKQYTILATVFTCGSITEQCDKEQVREECERLKKTMSISTHDYIRIEAINNETGEIREYWNNHNNKIEF